MDDLAKRIWLCRRDGGALAVPTGGGPVTQEEALAVQREAVAHAGMARVGYKVGSTSAEAQRVLGTHEPGASPVLTGFFHESPARVGVDLSHCPAVEGEFALGLGGDLPPSGRPYSFDDVADAVEAVAGAIEVVGSRFAGGLAGKGRFLTTADFGANIALVVGPWTENWRELNLAAHGVDLSVDGALWDSGTGARALGHPLNVLQWLADKQEGGLQAGEIVSTGTCTGLAEIAPGNYVVANFGTLGRVEVEFDLF